MSQQHAHHDLPKRSEIIIGLVGLIILICTIVSIRLNSLFSQVRGLGCAFGLVDAPGACQSDEDIQFSPTTYLDRGAKDGFHYYILYNHKIYFNSYANNLAGTFRENWQPPIFGADLYSFNVLNDDDGYSSFYAKDKNYVYYAGERRDYISAKTFKNISGNYFTDGQNIYFNDEKIINADLSSFVVTGDETAHDKATSYNGSIPTNSKSEVSPGSK